MKLIENGEEIPIKCNKQGFIICGNSKTLLIDNCSICGKPCQFTLKGYIGKRGRITPNSKIICRGCNKRIKHQEKRETIKSDLKLFDLKTNQEVPMRINKNGFIPVCTNILIKFNCYRCGAEDSKTSQNFKNLRPTDKLLCRNCINKDIHISQTKSNEEYLSELKEQRLDLVYDLSEVNYINAKTDIKLICKKCGTSFQHNPRTLLNGITRACPKCNYYIGEEIIKNILIDNNINFIPQYHFKNTEISRLSFDFYLPDKNVVIEYQGEQHYHSIGYFGGSERFRMQQIRDERKRQFCKNNNIKEIEINKNNLKNLLTIFQKNDIILS